MIKSIFYKNTLSLCIFLMMLSPFSATAFSSHEITTGDIFTLEQLQERHTRHNANGVGVDNISKLEMGAGGVCEIFQNYTTYDAFQKMADNIYIYVGEINGRRCVYNRTSD